MQASRPSSLGRPAWTSTGCLAVTVWGEQTLASDSQRRPRRSPSSCVTRARTCARCATLPRRRRPAVVSAWSPHSRPDGARISRPTARSSRPSSARESRKRAAPRRLAAACAGAPRKAPRRLIRGWIAAHGGVEAGHDLDHALIHSLLSVMRHIATRLLRASEPSSFLAGSHHRLLSCSLRQLARRAVRAKLPAETGPRPQASPPQEPTRHRVGCGSTVRELTLGGVEDAAAVLVGELVGAHARGEVPAGAVEARVDVAHPLLVVAGPWGVAVR